MLVQLSISNFAIIKHLELTIRPGLNILSGETGAGKSIIINAMNLILGGRASADLIRSGCGEAGVEALFSLPKKPLISDLLSSFGIPFDGELLIKRSVFREGRNKIFINGSMATLQMLAPIGDILVSVSGQREHQFLLQPENHLLVLDEFGGFSEERLKLDEVFGRHRSLKEKINKLKKEINSIGEREELERFQLQELEKANVRPDEDKTFFEEKRRLQHAEELLMIVSEGYQTLYERNDSVLGSISRCAREISKGAEIDTELGPIKDVLDEIGIKLEDASFALRDFQNNIHMDPDRLEHVTDRLELLNRLKRKYGPTLEDVLEFKGQLESSMYDEDEKRKRLEQLLEKRHTLEEVLLNMANILSKKRKKAARILEREIEKELHQLCMEHTVFCVKFDQDPHDMERLKGDGTAEIRPDGIDRVEFMISPNIGEELRPLCMTASGGELSRIMLAVKTILAKTASVETVIFDEVDSGISGAAAEVVGEKLLVLAGYHQILCITHLPQIASRGQTHFQVRKEISHERTHTIISELEPEERVGEIARLLGGREVTPRAVAHAREMLRDAEKK